MRDWKVFWANFSDKFLSYLSPRLDQSKEAASRQGCERIIERPRYAKEPNIWAPNFSLYTFICCLICKKMSDRITGAQKLVPITEPPTRFFEVGFWASSSDNCPRCIPQAGAWEQRGHVARWEARALEPHRRTHTQGRLHIKNFILWLKTNA